MGDKVIPSSKSSVILLSNVRRAPLNAMTKGIMGILYNKAYDMPKKSLAYVLLYVVNKEGIKKEITFYKEKKRACSYYSNKDEMNIVRYKLLNSDRAEAAVIVLELAVKIFSKSFNLYGSLGEVQRSLENNKEAILHYKKSVELNPANENGLKMLGELGANTNKLKK